MVVMFMVYKYIRDIEVRASRFTFTSYRSRSQRAERIRSRKVMIQGIMYAVAMLLVLLSFSATVFLRGFVARIHAYTLTPLQGFYNAFIYSGILQRWFFNNDGHCKWCSPASIVSSMNVVFSSMRSSMRTSSKIDKEIERLNNGRSMIATIGEAETSPSPEEGAVLNNESSMIATVVKEEKEDCDEKLTGDEEETKDDEEGNCGEQVALDEETKDERGCRSPDFVATTIVSKE